MTSISRQEYDKVCELLGISAYWDEVAEYDDNRIYSDGEILVEMAVKIKELNNET